MHATPSAHPHAVRRPAAELRRRSFELLVAVACVAGCSTQQAPPAPSSEGVETSTVPPEPPPAPEPAGTQAPGASPTGASGAPSASSGSPAASASGASDAGAKPGGGTAALGAPCTAAADCAPGTVCAGPEGCGASWTCQKQRPCTRDLAAFCGCDGATFRGSGSCPAQRYAHRGACKDAGAKPASP